MGLFKSPWRSKVAAVAAFQSPEPPAEEPAAAPPPPGRDAATIVEELAAMTDAVEAARVALARTGTIIPKMGFGEHLEAAEDELDACEAKLDVIVRLGRTSAAASRSRRAGARSRPRAWRRTRALHLLKPRGGRAWRRRARARPRRRIY